MSSEDKANKWDALQRDIDKLKSQEEMVFIIGGRAITVRLAEVDDLERVTFGHVIPD